MGFFTVLNLLKPFLSDKKYWTHLFDRLATSVRAVQKAIGFTEKIPDYGWTPKPG